MTAPGDRDPVRRGLLLVAWGVAIAAVLSILMTLLVQWQLGRVQEEGYASVRRTFETIGWVRMTAVSAAAVLVVAGCWLLGRAHEAGPRRWAYVAACGAAGRLIAVLSLFALQLEGRMDSLDELRVFRACASVASLILWIGVGMALRGLRRGEGRGIPAWAALIWAFGLLWDLAVTLLELSGTTWSVDGRVPWYMFYAGSMAIDASRLALVLVARRARASLSIPATAEFGRGDEDGERAASGLRLYRHGLIARMVILCATLLSYAFTLIEPSRPLMTVSLVLPLVETMVIVAIVAGLLRYASNVPGGAAGAVVGAGCIAVAGLSQLYGYSLVWRISNYRAEGADGISMWESPAIGELMEKVKLIPVLDLVTTLLALAGALVVLGSLRSLARRLDRRELDSRAATLSVWVAILAVIIGALRFYVASASNPVLLSVLLIGIFSLVGALGIFVQYVRLLGDLVAALRSHRLGVPSARVVSGADPRP